MISGPRRSTRISQPPDRLEPAHGWFHHDQKYLHSLHHDRPTAGGGFLLVVIIRPCRYLALHDGKEKFVPQTFAESVNCSDEDKWAASRQTEIKNLQRNEVFDVVRPASDDQIQNVIRPKWMFPIKYNKDSSVDKYKSRIVAKGVTQRYGIDYREIFSPVTHQSSRNLFYSLIATKGLNSVEFDVTAVFLTAKLESEFTIYMKPPQGIQVPLGNLLRIEKGFVRFGSRLSQV